MINPRARVIRTSDTSKASIYMEDESVSIIGNKDNFIVCDGRGITLRGPISIVADGMNIRTGGLFVGINDFMAMIPSTIVTPMPQKIPFPPVHYLKNIAKDTAFFIATTLV
jgi:hypothetical protein